MASPPRGICSTNPTSECGHEAAPVAIPSRPGSTSSERSKEPTEPNSAQSPTPDGKACRRRLKKQDRRQRALHASRTAQVAKVLKKQRRPEERLRGANRQLIEEASNETNAAAAQRLRYQLTNQTWAVAGGNIELVRQDYEDGKASTCPEFCLQSAAPLAAPTSKWWKQAERGGLHPGWSRGEGAHALPKAKSRGSICGRHRLSWWT